VKGRKVYVQGRIASRNWTGQDGQQRTTVEIVIDDMILLDSAGKAGSTEEKHESVEPVKPAAKSKKHEAAPKEEAQEQKSTEDVNPDDIPF
jgi:single-strand DNA-binding protein